MHRNQFVQKRVDFSSRIKYNDFTARHNLASKVASAGKEKDMDDEMSVVEILVEKTEENQTRKILDILNTSQDLEEAKDQVKALLSK